MLTSHPQILFLCIFESKKGNTRTGGGGGISVSYWSPTPAAAPFFS